MIAGYPAKAITNLIESTDIDLLPIDGPARDSLLQKFRFFHVDTIPADAYEGVSEIRTLGVNALWLVSEKVAEETVYRILESLWHPSARKLLREGHRQGEQITRISSLEGIDIPLHPGAIRYYNRIGLSVPAVEHR